MIACLRLYTVPAAGRFLLAQKATQKGAGTSVVPDHLLFIPVLEWFYNHGPRMAVDKGGTRGMCPRAAGFQRVFRNTLWP